jgi:hypothetical protein
VVDFRGEAPAGWPNAEKRIRQLSPLSGARKLGTVFESIGLNRALVRPGGAVMAVAKGAIKSFWGHIEEDWV